MLLLKSKNNKVSVSVGLNSSLMHPIISVFDTGSSQNLIRTDILETSWLENIRQRDMRKSGVRLLPAYWLLEQVCRTRVIRDDCHLPIHKFILSSRMKNRPIRLPVGTHLSDKRGRDSSRGE